MPLIYIPAPMQDSLRVNGHAVDVHAFRQAVIGWGRDNFRAFPWRTSNDPYRILIAEVMLHRTQASQVVPVYTAFVERFPDLASLASASRQDIEPLLYSLGLHWRVDLVYTMVVALMDEFDGHVPRDKIALLALPGVSDYIASAVRCFAWNEPDALIDTNTVRVVGRMFGLEIRDSSRRNRQFREVIEALVDPNAPRAYNYALLDLADRICTKKRPPDCLRCPVHVWCEYGRQVLLEGSDVAK